MADPDTSFAAQSITRETVQRAFVGLLFQRRYDSIRVGDIITAAGVGRSTFYTHFKSKDEVLLSAIEPILIALADGAAGLAHASSLAAVLEHVWEQRAMGRLIFTPELLPRLQRKLAAMIADRLEGDDAAMIATGLAAAQLAMLQLWVTGGAPSSAQALAAILIRPTAGETCRMAL